MALVKRMLSDAEKAAAASRYVEIGDEAAVLEERVEELRREQRRLMNAVMFGVEEPDPYASTAHVRA